MFEQTYVEVFTIAYSSSRHEIGTVGPSNMRGRL